MSKARVGLTLIPVAVLGGCDHVGYFYRGEIDSRQRVDHTAASYRQYKSDLQDCEKAAESATSAAGVSLEPYEIDQRFAGSCMAKRGYSLGIWGDVGWPPKWVLDLAR